MPAAAARRRRVKDEISPDGSRGGRAIREGEGSRGGATGTTGTCVRLFRRHARLNEAQQRAPEEPNPFGARLIFVDRESRRDSSQRVVVNDDCG